ncbi:GNAT family N-acetyltransferase [Panacibacter ginsenosidivorans]|uniref:GNAT family N-acetyltransferase n=1 Tax=Panacibacter ginsenosidivorans TaxID=1813871 RepID=A0A5B8VGI4_9BACT|nr:GNAT family protein [Panacibacter ginsenosidivorans]QEC69686.1 GNAT family N-acetyltransferase [Panacibacter ginsenosidivorans]
MEEKFDCSKNYILEDERVLLRPLQKEDHSFLLPFAMNEPDLWKFSLVTAAGEEGLSYYLQLALDARKECREYPFIVFDKMKNEYAGSTRFYDINLPFQTLQLGYTWYGQNFQGTGLNRHCKFLLLSFAFENTGMERVEFRADNDNARSIAAMKSIGCKVDGVLRRNMPKRDGGRRDSIVLSILKDEWFGGVKEMLAARLK